MSSHKDAEREPAQAQAQQPLDMMLWVAAACGWTLASMLFLVPAFYWLMLHALAVVGAFSLATGTHCTKNIWPVVENALGMIRRVAEALRWPALPQPDQQPQPPRPPS